MADKEAEFEVRDETVALTIPTDEITLIEGREFDKVVIDQKSWGEISDQEYEHAVEKLKEELPDTEEKSDDR